MKNNKIKINIYVFFMVIAFIWGLGMSLMVPMGQVPDEYTHFGFMLEGFGTNKLYPEDRRNFYEASGLIDVAQQRAALDRNAYFENGMKQYSLGLSDTGISFHFGAIKYIPGAVGYHLGVLLHLPMLICHQLSELTSLLFYIIICLIALKKMPYKKEVLLFVMLIPMAIHQAASINPDVVVNAISFLMIAMIFEMKSYAGKTEKNIKKIGWKDIILFAVLAFILMCCKITYLPLALGIFIVPAEAFELKIGKSFELAGFIKKYRVIAIILAVIFTALCIFLFRDLQYVKMLITCLSHPGRMLVLMKNTFGTYRDFYLQTFVGCFGWMDTFVSYAFIVLFMMMLLYINLFASKDDIEFDKTLSIKDRVYLMVLALVMLILIFFAMTIWSIKIAGFNLDAGIGEYGNYLYNIGLIQGVQGRYFIPFVPLVLLSLGGRNEIKNRKLFKRIQVGFYLFSLIYTIGIIRIRYWG